MHSRCLNIFPFRLGWGGEVLFLFLLIRNVSHQILNGLSSCSQLVLHDFVIFINAFPIAPLFTPYDLTNVVLLTPIEGPQSRNSTLLLWGVMHVHSLRDNKVFVSYHCHFRLQWKIHFPGLSKLLILRRFLFVSQWKIHYTIKLYLDSHFPQLIDMNHIIGSIYCIESMIAY
jgi:hypothetical protein